jgi:hypothetical protein
LVRPGFEKLYSVRGFAADGLLTRSCRHDEHSTDAFVDIRTGLLGIEEQ